MSENLPVELTPADKLIMSLVPEGVDLNHDVIFLDPIDARKKITAVAEAMVNLPSGLEQVRTSHRFADGLYIREVFIPAGRIAVGRIHRHSSPAFMCLGEKVTITDEGIFRLKAPFATIAKAGVQRIGVALQDCVWTTVHPNPSNTRDIKELEKQIYTDNFDDVAEPQVDTSEIVTFEGAMPCQES